MNIVVVSHDSFWPLYGGGGVRVYWFVKEMQKKHDVTVIAPMNSSEEECRKEFPNITLVNIGKFNRFMKNKEINYLRMAFKMRKALKRTKPDIIYCGSIVSALPAYLSKKAPVVYDMMDINTGLSNSLVVSTLGPQIEFYIAKRCKQVVTMSNAFKDELEKRGVRDVKVVYHGVDLERFNPAAYQEQAKSDICISMGGMEKHEGEDIIIRAIPYVVDKKPIKFIFIGKGSALPGLKQLAKELKVEEHITFIDWVDQAQIPAHLAKAKVGLISHRDSPACQVMILLKGIEYMSMGLPVVAPYLQGMLEMVGRSDERGLICNREDPESMAEKILELFSHEQEYKSKSEAAISYVKEQFDWRKNAEKMVQIIEDTAND